MPRGGTVGVCVCVGPLGPVVRAFVGASAVRCVHTPQRVTRKGTAGRQAVVRPQPRQAGTQGPGGAPSFDGRPASLRSSAWTSWTSTPTATLNDPHRNGPAPAQRATNYLMYAFSCFPPSAKCVLVPVVTGSGQSHCRRTLQ